MKMKTFSTIILATCLLPSVTYTQSAKEISEKATEAIDYESMEMTSTLRFTMQRAAKECGR
jgi:hypothetical protein